MSRGALRIWIIRHGDRFDYQIGSDAWKKVAIRPLDPPLSELGKKQALEMAEAVLLDSLASQSRPITRIISSPFLRCIETANPLAAKLDLPLLLDHSLFEIGHTDAVLPPNQERKAYFPRIDETYESVFKPRDDEACPGQAIERFGRTVVDLTEKFPGESVVLVTHAAGVVTMVSRLLKRPIRSIPPASPACLFMLERDSADADWVLSADFPGSIAHLSDLGLTGPWPRQDGTSSASFVDGGDLASWL